MREEKGSRERGDGWDTREKLTLLAKKENFGLTGDNDSEMTAARTAFGGREERLGGREMRNVRRGIGNYLWGCIHHHVRKGAHTGNLKKGRSPVEEEPSGRSRGTFVIR